MDKICVSIFMLTYNQENFIAQAIEGVLMQQTDFNFQLVIGEDCSTDKTREICKQYASKYPNKIKLLLADENLGLIENYIKTYSECTGKYVAICDGDDYWIDPFKLQNQVDFLEKNLEFELIFTTHKNLFPSGKIKNRDTKNVLEISSFNDLIFDNYIASVTVLFKNKKLPESMLLWMRNLPYGDWPTYLWVLKDGGKIKLHNELTAVYRKNFGTSTVLRKNRSRMGEINLSILQYMLKDSSFSERKYLINKSIIKYRIGLIASYNKEQKFIKSFAFFVYSLSLNFKKSLQMYIYSLYRTLLKKEG